MEGYETCPSLPEGVPRAPESEPETEQEPEPEPRPEPEPVVPRFRFVTDLL